MMPIAQAFSDNRFGMLNLETNNKEDIEKDLKKRPAANFKLARQGPVILVFLVLLDRKSISRFFFNLIGESHQNWYLNKYLFIKNRLKSKA